VARELTKRMLDILVLVSQHKTDREIAGELGVSKQRVYNILRAATWRLGARTRDEAVEIALRSGLLSPNT